QGTAEFLQCVLQLGQLRRLADRPRRRLERTAGRVDEPQGRAVDAEQYPVVADLLLAYAVGVEAEVGDGAVEELVASEARLRGDLAEGLPHLGQQAPPAHLD